MKKANSSTGTMPVVFLADSHKATSPFKEVYLIKT